MSEATQPDPTSVEAGPVLEAFSLDQERRGLSPETVRVRRVVIGAFERWRGGDLLAATKAEINAWLDSLDLTTRSRAKYLSHLHNLYAFAIREELTGRDPTLVILRPRSKRLLPRPVPDDALAFVLEMAPPAIEAMLSLAAYQGLRCKEIAGQLVEDLFLDRDPPVMVVSATKGDQPRVLPLAEAAEEALKRHGLPRSGHLFLTYRGRPYKAQGMGRKLSDYLRGVGVNATAHRLRHWFASECYRRSHDLRMTQELMGHSSIATTQSYVAWSPTEAAGVVRTLECQPRR